MTPREPDAQFDQLLLLVGRLNYSWTNTESLLIHLIAGLGRMDKDTAVIIFLTLNTTRARIDLVERLAKMERVDAAERDRVLELTREMVKVSAMRNRYNHALYAFDPVSGHAKAIQMRIAERKGKLKMGQTHEIDQEALNDIETALKNLGDLNRRAWEAITAYNYPL